MDVEVPRVIIERAIGLLRRLTAITHTLSWTGLSSNAPRIYSATRAGLFRTRAAGRELTRWYLIEAS